jgi:nicotinate-nucleotide adenylyltransferase
MGRLTLPADGRSPRLGIFGGTFDPPHIGHLILAAEAQDQLALDRLLWVLTPDPPHKQDRRVSPAAVRLELLQAALQDDPSFELSRIDLDRPAPHYAVDTVRLLRAAHPAAHLVYLMGEDSLHDLPTWHDPTGFLAAADEIGVMCRPGVDVGLAALESRLPGLTAKLHIIEAPLLEIASRQIRARVAAGRAYRYYLLPRVAALVQARRLYV